MQRLGDLDVREALERGFRYLMAHRLARSIRTGEVIGPHWLTPIWPRFYEYDLLRGTAKSEFLDSRDNGDSEIKSLCCHMFPFRIKMLTNFRYF